MTNKITGGIMTLAAAGIVLVIALPAAGVGMGMFLSAASLIWVVGVAGG